MTKTELEAVLEAVLVQCYSAGHPLNDDQRQILEQVMVARLLEADPADTTLRDVTEAGNHYNPLDEMTSEHRQALLDFIRLKDGQTQAWRTQLLNDWVQGNDSGELQFIREQYGPQWLNRVEPAHLAKYLDAESLSLQVGDRIEVSNGLWEWVQDDGPCPREWVNCTVIGIHDVANDSRTTPPSYRQSTTCVVRFETGREFEIQGVYEWNRYNWRWPGQEEA
jgi:hypothetical protein